ncbi:MAG: cation:proton antiporter [Pseudomonadota bacterium]
MENFLFQSTIYLLAACIAVPLAVRLGLGSVLGYLSAGIIIGPVGGLVGSETVDLQHFAEFGVVMMLFLIGLELQPKALWDMRHRLVGLGGLQISLTTGLVYLAVQSLGYSWSISLAVGMVCALSSTAIVLQTLTEKSLMQTGGGRGAFSVLLTQDIAVIPMLALLPLLAIDGLNNRDGGLDDGAPEHGADHHGPEVLNLLDGLPGWGVTLVTLGAVIVIILGGHFLTRPVFRYIHLARLREMYTAVSLLFIVGVAVVMLIVGLSPALGAFMAGVVLANSEFRHELEADLAPFKGLLLGLFFITVGAGISFGTLFGDPLRILGLTLGLMLIKAAVLYVLGLLFRLKGRDKILFTLSLAQAGEFGFVLLSFTTQQDVIPNDLGEMLLLIVALSMLFTPLLFIGYDALAHKLGDQGQQLHPEDEIDDQQPVIIAGVGRFGQVVNRLVQHSGFPTTVLDHNLETIQLMRRFGFKGFFGDPTRPELLHAAGLNSAKVLVVAMDDMEAALKLVKFARKERPDLPIIARARDRVQVFRLYKAGATHIVREMFDSSLRAGRYALEELGLTEHEAHEQEVMFFKMDRAGVAELARVWDPNVPVMENQAYIDRAHELNADLETALVSTLSEKRPNARSEETE